MEIQDEIKQIEEECNLQHERGNFDFEYMKSESAKIDVDNLLKKIDVFLENTDCSSTY